MTLSYVQVVTKQLRWSASFKGPALIGLQLSSAVFPREGIQTAKVSTNFG